MHARRESKRTAAAQPKNKKKQNDRVGLIHTLATLPEHPESVPINALVPVEGTPLEIKVF